MAKTCWVKQVAVPVLPTTALDATGVPIGMPIGDCLSFRLTIYADAGQTLSGTGTMRCIMWYPTVGAWLRCPSMDQPVDASAAGFRGLVFRDVERYVHDAVQVYFYRDGVGVSGGDVTAQIDSDPRNR